MKRRRRTSLGERGFNYFELARLVIPTDHAYIDVACIMIVEEVRAAVAKA